MKHVLEDKPVNRKNKSNENTINEIQTIDQQHPRTYQLSEQDYRYFFEHNPNAILVADREGKFISVNRAGEQLSGYSSDELIGMPFAMLCSASELEENEERFEQDVQGNRTGFETVMVRKDGQHRNVSVVSAPLMDGEDIIGVYAIVEDITESKNTERKLNDQLAEIESVYENAPVGLSFVDTDLRYVRINSLLAEMNGKSVAEHIGSTVSEIIPELEDIVLPIYHRVIESGCPVLNIELSGTTKANPEKTHYWLASFFPTKSESGSVQGVIASVQDITELRQAHEMLQESQGQAEAANLAKSQFLANMSHEIRTPMSVIMGFVDLMGMRELADEEKSEIDIAQKAGESLLRIIDDILDVSRIEVGALELHPTDFRLQELLDGAKSMMQPLAEEKGLQLAVICSDRLPAVIHTDYGRVQQCLLNLINNAIKFTEKGHVCVKVSLEDKDKRPFLRIDVEDTGIGIPSDRLDSVFDSFTRSDAGRNHIHSGSGLGLRITMQLARLLGGDVTVTSEIDKGSVFSLAIPVGTAVSNEDDNEPVYEREAKETPRFSGKVLIVDDHDGIRKLFRGLLERFGLEVTLAKNGEEAIEIVLRQPFDLVFMDVLMPKLDGYETTRKLKEKGITTPIVALTAYAMESDREECLEAGSDDYLSKPIDREELKRILSKYVPA